MREMRFLVQLLLSFLVGLAVGYLLLSVWDIIAPAVLRSSSLSAALR